MHRKILVLVEHWEGKLKTLSLEAIGFAQMLAAKGEFSISIVILGDKMDTLADQISKQTGLEVISISNEYCQRYSMEVYCDLLVRLIGKLSPFLVVMGHSYETMDFGPKLAAMLEKSFIPNCTGLNLEPGRLVLLRSVYEGKLNQEVCLEGTPPYLVSLQQGRFKKCLFKDSGLSRVAKIDLHLTGELDIKRRVLEIVEEVKGRIDLCQAEVIVAGGRGIGSKENFKIIFDLASVLGGSVGATRPVVDNGWLPKEHQVGSSGHTVAPKLYIACGISGRMQHLVGIMNSNCIVAINKDPYAPIFQVANYGIVGDLFAIIPIMIQSVKEMRDVPVNQKLNYHSRLCKQNN